MKSFVTKIFMLLAVVAMAAGCGDDKKSNPVPQPQPQPGPQYPVPGPVPTNQHIFKSIKFGVDYVGTIQVINVDEWAQQQASQQQIEQFARDHNLPESQQSAYECAGGTYYQPRLANIRVWFERVCEYIPGVFEDFRRLFVRMYVLIDIPVDGCAEGIQIQENYDFFENATALDGNPNNMIHKGYMGYIVGSGNFSFDSQNLNLTVTNLGNGLQGRLGTMLMPPSLYNVNLTLAGGRGFTGTSFNNAFGGHCYGGSAQTSYTTNSPGNYVPPPPPPAGSNTNYGPAAGGQGSNSQPCHNNGLANR